MAREREMSHLPLKVLVNFTDQSFSKNVENLRTQVASAGASLDVQNNLSAAGFLDLISSLLPNEQVAVIDQGLVTGQAMIDSLVKGQWSTSAALVKSSSGNISNFNARVIHKRIVSAATIEHHVTQPSHTMLGFICIGTDEKSRAAVQNARDYCTGVLREINVGDLITVALVRAGAPVVAIGITGVCVRAISPEQLDATSQELLAQDETEIRLKRALRADDGFYSTFVLRKLSQRVSMLAIKKNWTPNQITLTSLVVALVVALCFATGWWPLMILGAIGVQAAIIIDCADGEVARYTGVSSQRGAWLDASTDRVKEYALYAGLAFGASHHGMNLWPLAMGVMVLQTVRHMSDYNFNAVQVIRESAVLPQVLINKVDNGATSNGTLLDASAQLNSNSKVRWLKKVIHFPIGERWLVISLAALFNAPAVALWGLLVFGLIGISYTTVGRVLRSKNWNHPQAISGSEVLARQIDPGLGVAWFWADDSLPLGNRFAWSVPAILRLFELGLVFAIAHNYPIAYLWIFAVAFHHYDALYRALAGYEIPANIKSQGLGFLGRSLVIVLASLGFVISLETTLVLGGIIFSALFVGYASRQWLQIVK
jgi:hypothetical protein